MVDIILIGLTLGSLLGSVSYLFHRKERHLGVFADHVLTTAAIAAITLLKTLYDLVALFLAYNEFAWHSHGWTLVLASLGFFLAVGVLLAAGFGIRESSVAPAPHPSKQLW